MNNLKELYQSRDKPIVFYNLEIFKSQKTSATDFEHSFYSHDKVSMPINAFEDQYRRAYDDIHNKGIARINYRTQKRALHDTHYGIDLQNWVKRLDTIEQSTKGCLWVLKDDQPTCVSGSDAEKDEMYIAPHFTTNPHRFESEYIPVSPLQDYTLHHTYRKVNDCLAEHLSYKKFQVWSIEQIGIFLQAFFKIPKKFEEIKKHLPQKTVKEVVQLFYLLKYQFKLKKLLRIQARRRREELIKEHTKMIVEVFRKRFPNQEYISQQDISNMQSNRKFVSREAYFEKFGKDTSKIQQAMRDFQDYSRYKETAFGGERLTDEGPFNGEDISRKGSSQWTYEEKMMFIKHFKQFGRNWIEIAGVITTKSASQVRNFFQNYKKKLKLDSISVEQDEITILAAAGITKK